MKLRCQEKLIINTQLIITNCNVKDDMIPSYIRQKKITKQDIKKLQIFCLILCFLILLWIIFSPISGGLRFFSVNEELSEIQAENINLKKQNTALEKEIERLENDPEYMEEVARKKFKLLKKNEIIYDFNKKK